MKSLQRFFARLSNLTARSRADQRLREEMEEHLAQQTADNLRAGMCTAEAHRQAVLKFGAAEAIRQHHHTELRPPLIETYCTICATRFASLRLLPVSRPLRSSRFALGIGATTAI
jgi:hypothetical protein